MIVGFTRKDGTIESVECVKVVIDRGVRIRPGQYTLVIEPDPEAEVRA